MSNSSASTDHSTTESRRRDQWASVRLLGGLGGLILVVTGTLGLAVLATNDGQLTSRVGSGLAGCIVAVVGGGLLARAGSGSQRAADRTAAFMSRLDADDNRLDELFGELAELRNTQQAALLGFAEDRAARERHTAVLEKFLAHEEEVDQYSEKARGDVAEIRATLAVFALEMSPSRIEQATHDAVRRALSELHTAILDVLRRRTEVAGWSPSDTAWLEDVAEAFELGKQMGNEPS